jgi:hypothetical protein
MEKLVDIVKNNDAKFTHATAGVLYYKVETEKMVYIFPVDMNDTEDVGTATFEATHKALHLMRYLNKAIKNENLVFYEKN